MVASRISTALPRSSSAWPPTRSIGKPLEEIIALVDETDRRLLSDPVKQALTTGAPVNLSRRALLLSKASGAERSIELSASPIRDGDKHVTGAVVLLHDVTELRGLARQMSYQATHDALTGLVNRREFERRLEEAVDNGHRGDGQHVLCYLDLDRFKVVNDTSGHLAGDSMLREVAKLLRDAVRDSDTVARLGGDEFGMLLIGCPLEKARQIADDVCRVVADYRFVWKDKIFNIGTSIGLVEVSRESGTLEELMAAADSACYVAKKQGTGRVAVYSARDEALARHSGEIQWLQRLQTALKENRFQLYHQPIVPAFGDDTGGPAMEVLVRLQDELGHEVPPSEFVRAAERYRLMGLVDRWVVQTTLAALGRGAILVPATRSVAINISGQTLGDTQFLEFVVECLDSTGVSPAQVCFEITESAVVANMDHARRFVGVLHGMGCQFALDDFGSGVGSFSNLKNLPMDYLKIDGSFTAQPVQGHGQPGHGDRDDQARQDPEFQGNCRAGGRRRRARGRAPHGCRLHPGLRHREAGAAVARRLKPPLFRNSCAPGVTSLTRQTSRASQYSPGASIRMPPIRLPRSSLLRPECDGGRKS